MKHPSEVHTAFTRRTQPPGTLSPAIDDPGETEYYILGDEYGRQKVWFELNEAETRLYNERRVPKNPSNDMTNFIYSPTENPFMAYITPCGLDCSDCEAYKATQADDQTKLAELASKWSRESHKWTVEVMRCDGCLEPRIFAGCSVCAVRECAIEKGVTLCKDCPEYACDKLNYIWKHAKVKPEIIEANYAKAK